MANRSSHYSHGFSWRLKSSADKHVSSNYYSQMEFFKKKTSHLFLHYCQVTVRFCVLDKTLVCYYNKSA